MLILPKGYKQFNEKLATWDPKNERKRNWQEDGFETPDVVRKDVPERAAWDIPANFCPDCGRNQIYNPGRPGIFIFPNAKPELHMRKGDCIHYRRCSDCTKFSVFERENGTNVVIFSDGDWKRARARAQTRIQENLETYIKSRILAGENPMTETR
ncbi:MAG TPA: hypothetical protein V6C86_24185 [Oculatellaceae cyanobacterium]